VTGPIAAGTAVAFTYTGITLGSFASGFLSQVWGSRKKVVGLFILLTLAGIIFFLTVHGLSPAMYYMLALYLGLTTGYWAVFVTIGAEQFGTNLRSTVATTVPNFVRGAVPLITGSFVAMQATMGFHGSAAIVGGVCFLLALGSLVGLRETHGLDLDYME
jgi:MFS family permease